MDPSREIGRSRLASEGEGGEIDDCSQHPKELHIRSGRRRGRDARRHLASEGIQLDAFRKGMEVELEHGSRDTRTNVTDDDPVFTGNICLAHLRELPDYYDRLEEMERQSSLERPTATSSRPICGCASSTSPRRRRARRDRSDPSRKRMEDDSIIVYHGPGQKSWNEVPDPKTRCRSSSRTRASSTPRPRASAFQLTAAGESGRGTW